MLKRKRIFRAIAGQQGKPGRKTAARALAHHTDAVGIDPNQVIRTDPRAGANDFESNCFASIEFDRPDLPWLLTPARANSAKQLRPWLCLVVLRKQCTAARAIIDPCRPRNARRAPRALAA